MLKKERAEHRPELRGNARVQRDIDWAKECMGIVRTEVECAAATRDDATHYHRGTPCLIIKQVYDTCEILCFPIGKNKYIRQAKYYNLTVR